jgi:hypothetical protein
MSVKYTVTQPILESKWMDMLLHEIGLVRKARQGPVLAVGGPLWQLQSLCARIIAELPPETTCKRSIQT